MTASRVGSIAKIKRHKVKELLYSTFKGNKASCTKEDQTIQPCITHQRQNGHSNLTVEKSGLFVSISNPWIAASMV